ncbi:hypothetical protein X742_30750 [Mesorhizobium sp. LNHC232B00]|nr:hypothetical protein X742_30750 [Mesorhizobium sp. LNHC232B00]
MTPRMPRYWALHADIKVDHVISNSLRDYWGAQVELPIL